MAWHAKRTYGYLKESTEAIDNATEIANQLTGYGWSLAAIAAALGNQEGESGYNPWRWQYNEVLPYGDSRIGEIGGGNTQHAYGLFQQDPAAKYLKRPYAMALSTYAPNYSDRAGQPHDGNAQVNYLHWICSDPNGGEWQSSGGWGAEYKMSYSDFINNTQGQTVAYLTHTFFYGYERGTWGENRVTAANYWYEYFSGHPPTPTPSDNGAWFAVFHKVIRQRNSGLVLKKGMFNIK